MSSRSDRLAALLAAAQERAQRASAYAQTLVDVLAQAAFDRVWDYLVAHPGADARQVILDAQVSFGGGFASHLATAFSELLGRSIFRGDVVAMPVGDISLSRRIYLHNVETAAEVSGIVREHAKGLTQARALALRLYDGYDPKDGIQRPLEGRARADLPKALRALTADADARRELDAIMLQAQKQAARLKTRALRAAYLDAFQAWEAGAGAETLKRKLWVAQREKNRFFADRIAQTELHRAHQAKVVQELRADEMTTVVRVKVSATHPRLDICDLHARADLWGLGPGNYPKAKAPVPPFHPFCRCSLGPRASLDASDAVYQPMGEHRFLSALTEQQAGQVMGSRERARRMSNGAMIDDVVNAGKDPLYRLRRIENMPDHPLVPLSVDQQP